MDDGLRARAFRWPPLRLARLRCERVSVCVVCPLVLRRIVCDVEEVSGELLAGRAIGLDVHLRFCEVAICEEGKVRSAGRVQTTPEELETLAESLLPTDRVALEVTGSAWEIVRILEPHVSEGDRGLARAIPGSARRARRPTGSTRGRWRKLLWRGELDGGVDAAMSARG